MEAFPLHKNRIVVAVAGILLLAAYVAGMFTDIMEIDATQYASMARNLLTQENPLMFFDRGDPYLDKPPLIFWLSALSFKAFGINTFAYKLPSVLFCLLAVVSAWGWAKRHYGDRAGWIAALLLASCQAIFVMNQDVKTDMYLTGSVTFALWMFAAFVQEGKWHHLLLGFVGVGLGLLAKGPLGIVLPGLGVGGHLLLSRNWRGIFNWRWLVGVPILALMLTPMCIGLYQQHGAEGLEFFFWTQSFGRITGDSSWKNDTTPFFLIHSFAWSFLPWTLLFLGALGKRIWELIQNRGKLPEGKEGYSLVAFLIGGLSLATSNFILPHYAYVLVPFGSVILAGTIVDWVEKVRGQKLLGVFSWIHFGLMVLMLVLLGILLGWAFFPPHPVAIVLYVLLCAGFLWAFFRFKKQVGVRVWLPAVIAMAGINLILNSFLYPTLMKYQSGSVAAKYILQEQIPAEKVYGYGDAGRSLDTYLKKDMKLLAGNEEIAAWVAVDELYLFVTPIARDQLAQAGFQFAEVKAFDHFNVNRLSLPFIIPASRDKVVGERFLLRLPRQSAAQ